MTNILIFAGIIQLLLTITIFIYLLGLIKTSMELKKLQIRKLYKDLKKNTY